MKPCLSNKCNTNIYSPWADNWYSVFMQFFKKHLLVSLKLTLGVDNLYQLLFSSLNCSEASEKAGVPCLLLMLVSRPPLPSALTQSFLWSVTCPIFFSHQPDIWYGG